MSDLINNIMFILHNYDEEDNIFNINNDFSNILYDTDMHDISISNIKEWCKSNNISDTIIFKSIRYWRENNKFPTLDDLVNVCYSSPYLCTCYSNLNKDFINYIIKFLLINYGLEHDCVIINFFKEYYRDNGYYPSINNINEMINRYRNAFDDSNYHNDKVKVGTKNLDKIKVYIMDKNKDEDNKDENKINTCSLCVDNIFEKQSYYKLTPCGHIFHAKDNECINSTIINWLKENHICPNCRNEVNISDSKDINEIS